MTTSPVILNDTILSNGSMAVLAGDPYKQVVQLPNGLGGTFPETYYGFDHLQVAIISANNSPVTLNQSSGNLSFAAAGDSPNQAVPGGNGLDQGDETTGGGNILALSNGDMAVVTWGDYNHNYDLQILNSSGSVVTAPFVIGNSLEGPSPIAGNPFAAIATNGSEFVVAWNTDDITGLYFERFSLTGTPIGSVVTVKTPSALNPATASDGNPANNNSNFGDSLAIDSQGNVILGFSADDIYHSGYFELYNNSNTQLVGAPSGGPVMGSGTILNQDQAPVFAPVAGGGFITAGYTISPGTFSGGVWSNYNSTNADWNTGTFTLNVQKISTTGSASTIATVTGFPGDVQTREAFGQTTLSNGLVAFQEDGTTNNWDTLNPTGNVLTRNAFSVTPGAYNGTPTFASSYHSIPFPIVNVTGGGFATLSVNSSNQLVASGLDTAAAPVITAGATVTFDGGGSAVTFDSGLTVTDTGSSTLVSATVSVGTGFISGDTLNFTNQTGITGSYNSGTGVLSLSGTTTLANYQTALDSISYSFSPANGDPTNGGADTSRTIDWSANDGTASSSTANSTLNVVHEPPVAVAGASVSYEVGAAASLLDVGLTVSDPDSGGNLSSATVSIGTGFHAGDTLAFTNQNGITGSYNSGTGVLSLSGTATLANYQTALESIGFSGATTTGSRTIHWTVNDGVSGSTDVTSTVTVTGGPSVTAGATATFDGGGSAVTLDSGISLSDPSNANLSSATVSITAGFLSGDMLNFTTQNGITGNYNSGTHVLTLSGTTTLANYQTALDSITYSFSPTNGDPTGGGSHTSRTISWATNDGTASSAAATSTLNVVHEPPAVTAGATITYGVGGSPGILDAPLTVSDPDSNGNLSSATVSIGTGFDTANDALGFSNQNGISGVYNSATGVLSLSGVASLANYQTALESVVFTSTTTTPGSRTIDWAVNDGVDDSNIASSTVNVTVGPVLTAGATASFTGGGSAVTLDGALIVTDSASTTINNATILVNTGFFAGDTLNFIDQNGITHNYNSSTGVLTLTGTATVAAYQTAFDSITYSFTPANGDPTNGGADTSRQIEWLATDGVATSSPVTSTLNVAHAGPSVTAGATATFNGGGAAVTLDGALTVSDPDSGGNLVGATVSIVGFFAGDLLNFTNQNGITGSYNAGTGLLTLSGTSSLANYQTALDSITYGFNPANGDPTGGGTHTSRTIQWAANDGVVTSSATSTLNVAHAGPSVTAGATATFNGGGAAVTLDGALTVSDPDSGGNLVGATVSIVGFFAGDLLNFTNQNGITGSYNAGTGLLTLSGPASLVNYQTALDSISYSFNPANDDPTGGGTHTSRTIQWAANDGVVTSSATSTLNVAHAGPSVTAGATATFNGGGAAVTLDGALTVSDPDSGGNLVGATVSIVGFFAGDLLNFTNHNGITGSYNAGTGLLTLSGPASLVNYQTALDSISYSFNPANDDPTGGGTHTSRTIQWAANDGVVTSSATSTLNVAHAGPVVTAGASVIYALGGIPATLDSSLAVSDADSGGNLVGATVSVAAGFMPGDTLSFTNQNGISGVYNGASGVLTLSGTASLATYQSALDSIAFSGTSLGGRTIGWTVTDGVASSAMAASSVQSVPAPAVTAISQNVVGNQQVAFSPNIFTVAGSGVTQYQVIVDNPAGGVPADGIVTDNNNPVPLGTVITDSSLGGLQFTGGAAPGFDFLVLRAFNGAWSDWSTAVIADQGITPPVVTAISQSVAAGQPVAFSPNIFSVAGFGITQYQVIVDNPAGGAPADGAVTDNNNPVPLGTVITDSSLAGLQFTGGAASGQDYLVLRAFNGAWSDWTTAVITDQGITPPVVTAISQSVAAGQPVAFSPNIFSVAGSGITQYQVIVDNPAGGAPADGAVTDNNNPVPLGTVITDSSLAGLQFTGGAAPGQDYLVLRAFNGAWSGWATAVITDQGSLTMTGPLPGSVAAGSGANLITLGPNQTFQDGPAIYADTVVGFDAAAGDRIALTTDTVANALAHATQINAGQDTLVTLADTSTILLKGVNHIDATLFS